MSKEEIEKAIEKLNSIVKVHNRFFKGCKEEKISEKEIEAIETVLGYVKELEEKIKNFYEGEIYTCKQLKNIEENQKKYFINKQVIRDKINEILNIQNKCVEITFDEIILKLEELLEE